MTSSSFEAAGTIATPRVSALGVGRQRRRKRRGSGHRSPHAVYADREKTHQILINLVSNAVKFTKAGGEITIDCEPDGDVVHFLVTDTGEGIPAEKLGSIFEPFVQVKTGFTREHDGVGLGLAISRDLAQMMHGDLTVTSRIGQGSRFTLTLPRSR
jgi:signal transduction histidine kinase